MNGKRHIPLLLLICFSVFVGHNLIPHHHHTEAISVAIDGDCPIDLEDHHNTNDPPLHCHAFNSVNFVKYSHVEIQQPVRVISTLTLPDSKIQLEPPASFEFQRSICLKIPDKSTGYYGAISLRAPPPFSA